MAPRFTALIIVGIVIYVSLSLYHWRQVKKFPGKDKQNGVHSVLARDSHEKNWVQVSTNPGESAVQTESANSEESREETHQENGQKVVSESPRSLQNPSPKKGTVPSTAENDLQSMPEDIPGLQKTLQKERKESRQQKEKIKELYAQLITLQKTLDETAADLQEKEQALAEQEKTSPAADTVKSVVIPDAEKKETLDSLQRSLGSKIDALAKANERILGLAERLDQTRQTLENLESTNAHLKAVLTETETAKIKALQETENLSGELMQIREDRERYLAETGRLHAELQQAKTRLTRLENDLDSKQLQTEAMLRYGQQQNELINPFRQEIEILNARVEDRDRELIETEDQLSNLIDEKQSLQQEIVQLQLELQKNEHLSQELKKTSQELTNEQKNSADLTEQLKVLAGQLKERDESINRFQTDLANTQNALSQAEVESSKLKEENSQQQQDLTRTSQELTQLRQQLEAAKTDQLKVAASLEQERRAKEKLAMEMAELKQHMEGIKAESAQLAAQLEEKNAMLVSLNTKRGQPSSPSESPDPSTVPAPDQEQILQAQAEETIQQLKKSLAAAEERLAETEPELQKLKQSLAQAERTGTDDAAIPNLQKEIEQLKAVNAEKVQKQKDMEQRIEELKGATTNLQERNKELENSLKEYAQVESELNEKTSELLNKQERIKNLEEKTAELKSALDSREKEFFNMQAEYSSLQNQFDSLQQERDKLFLYTLDSDQDSISDAVDKCPGTFDGAKTGADGCELDSDQDGLVDRLDLCPASPEGSNINPLGCTEGEPIVLTGLYFSGGNAELSPAAKSYLDEVAHVLLQNKDIHLEVGGHTDSIGDIDRNKTVSRQRAKSVTAYLEEKGIKESRLISVGYGSEQPMADNETAAGRAANRRVELRIISTDEINSPDDQQQTTEPATEAD